MQRREILKGAGVIALAWLLHRARKGRSLRTVCSADRKVLCEEGRAGSALGFSA